MCPPSPVLCQTAGTSTFVNQLTGKAGPRTGVPNDKENDRSAKPLKFETDGDCRPGGWLAPNSENLNKILSPFQVSFSGHSETSLSDCDDRRQLPGALQSSCVSDSLERTPRSSSAEE